MRVLEKGTSVSFFAGAVTASGALACLRDTALGDRFHFWRGASNRRYAMSVAIIESVDDCLGAAATLPDFDGFVLISVVRSGTMRWPLAIVAIERSCDRRAAVVEALAGGACEWHVHLLGSDRAARAAIVDDLRSRHGCERQVLSA